VPPLLGFPLLREALCLGCRQSQANEFAGLPVDLGGELVVKPTETLKDDPPLGVAVFIVEGIAEAHG
jgi:hypothetical protein